MRGVWCGLLGLVALGALAGCKSSWFEAREPWRREAEEACLKSGAVKESPAIAMLRPIEGPGMCGADFPLKVAALGENEAMGYAPELRPPGAVPGVAPAPQSLPPLSAPSRAVTSTPLSAPSPGYQTYSPSPPTYSSSPSYSPAPYSRPSYDATPAPNVSSRPAPVSLDPTQAGGPNAPTYYPPIEREPLAAPRADGGYQPSYQPAPYDPREQDYRDEEYPQSRQPYPPASARQRAPYSPRVDAPYTTAPAQSPRMSPLPPLGPARRPIQSTATVSPAATLACPIVSTLDSWIKDSVQPSANRWFNSPVVEIKQISAYSCRGMNGQPGARISEHAFGNALDIAAFVLADGRKVTVKDGWRGTPEEQGFLHDIQASACELFTTVLAPGSNAYHYDHIHVDLMRRSSGRRICQPGALSGEEVAARAARNGPMLARQQGRSYDNRAYDNRMYGPRRDLIEPDSDPFAYRGPRDGMPTGSIATQARKKTPAPRGHEPIDDEDILHVD